MLLPRRDPAPDAQAAARLAALRPVRVEPPVGGWVAPAPGVVAAPPVVPAAAAVPAAPLVPAPAVVPAAPVVPAPAAVPAAPLVPAPAVVPAAPVVPAPPAVPAAPVVSDPPVVPAPPVVPERPATGWVTPVPEDDRPVRSWSYVDGHGELEQDLEPEPTLLQRLRAGRTDPGRRGVAALALVAVLAAALTAVVVVRGRPQAVTPSAVVSAGTPVPGSSGSSGAAGDPGASGAPGPSGAAAARVVVAVSGDVRRPGLVRLPAGSRVDDAVRAAGGARRASDLALVNLARVLVDGEQVVVGPAAPAPVTGGTGGAGGTGGVLDLNAATAEDLDELPGIGPVLADKIVAYRTEQGRFGSVDQLREVSGIGEARFADLEKLVRV